MRFSLSWVVDHERTYRHTRYDDRLENETPLNSKIIFCFVGRNVEFVYILKYLSENNKDEESNDEETDDDDNE